MTSLKVLVDKTRNRVVFAESDDDFTDVLFSFLTMPMGTIIRLISNQPSSVGIGCMNNLYESVKNLDEQYFRTEACKNMLLYPRNVAATQCKRLKLQIDDGEPPRYFLCAQDYYHNRDCTLNNYKSLSLYRNAICECGLPMDYEITLSENNKPMEVFDARDRGVFVKGLNRFIVSDELQVKPSSAEASRSVLYKLGLMDSSGIIEVLNVNISVAEVLTLLKCSLVSQTPLTETFLKHNISVPELGKEDFEPGSYIGSRMDSYIVSRMEEPESNVNGKITVKLMVSKSKKRVCYAEASEDFVDLLFSFLAVPLGYIVKEMQHGISKGSLNNLYKSIQELDAEKYLKSNEHKAMLVSPKLAPGFSYEKHPLCIEEGLHPPYCFLERPRYGFQLTSDDNIPSDWTGSFLTVKDPKSRFKETNRGGGFVMGPVMFTVTDNLIITPISQISSLSLLNDLKLPFSDMEEQVVHVGSEEAFRLLVASFVSESALTKAFFREPKPEF